MFRTRTDCERIHRRGFLTAGAAGLLGLSLADLLRSEAAGDTAGARRPATGVIQIWLSGGPATIDMWDLKPEAPEEIRGEFRPIETAAPGVMVTEHMPGLASLMNHCALVRSLGHTITAHGPGTTYMATGNRPSAALDYPALGSLAARVLPSLKGVPPYVTFAALRAGVGGAGGGYLGPAFGPFEVEGEPVRAHSRRTAFRFPAGFPPATWNRARRCGAALTEACGRSKPPMSWRAWTVFTARRSSCFTPTGCGRLSTWRSSRTWCATNTAGPRWGRGPWRPGG